MAIRVSSHPVARLLAQKLGAPIISTSLNLSGEPPVYDLKELSSEMRKQINVILDEGVLKPAEPSTIARINGEEIEIIREGPIHLKNETK